LCVGGGGEQGQGEAHGERPGEQSAKRHLGERSPLTKFTYCFGVLL
jgi:hypothetical protein